MQALVAEAEEEQWGLYQLAMEGNTTKKVEFRGTRLGYHPDLGKGIVAAYDIPAADKQRVSAHRPLCLATELPIACCLHRVLRVCHRCTSFSLYARWSC